MAKKLHLVHVKSHVLDKAPSAETLNYGEIAVNYNVNSPALYIKDDEENIVKFGPERGNAKIFYGICSTGATTAAKVVECAEFDTVNDFIPGCMISVLFTYKNTAASEDLTLKIGSSGTYTAGKPIRESYANLDNLQYIHNTALASGSIITFIYNGNEWQLIGSTNSVY